MIYTGKAEKISLYINSKRKSIADVKAETGCTAVINGGLYDMSAFEAVCHLKADGKVYAQDQYKYWGFAWDANELRLVTDYAEYSNYICCICMVRDGKAEQMYYNAVGGKRERTAVGVFADGRVWLYASKDKLTPEQLQKIALEAGVLHAIMLDGGGSTQCIFPDGNVTSARRVHNFICVWEENTEKEDDANMNGASVKVYSKAKDGNKKVSANFRVKEFACNDGSDPVIISPKLVTILQKIRTYFGKAVTINSAYRTPTHNKSEGGTTYSYHLYGMAADIVVKGVAPKTVAAYAEKLMPNNGGIGVYNSFVHVDVRTGKSRWNG